MTGETYSSSTCETRHGRAGGSAAGPFT